MKKTATNGRATNPTPDTQEREIADLKARLAEAEETLRAIHSGEVDALVVTQNGQAQVYTLKGADEAYRMIVQTMNEGAVTINGTGIVLYCNQRFAEMLETPMERIIGQPVLDFFCPAYHVAAAEQFRAAARETTRSEAQLCTSSGGVIPVAVATSLLRVSEVDSITVIFSDLTEQKRVEAALQEARDRLEENVLERTIELTETNYKLEEEIDERRQIAEELRQSEAELRRGEVDLRQSEERFRTLFETMTQGVVITDADGRPLVVNSVAEQMLGVSAGDIQQRSHHSPQWKVMREDGTGFPAEEVPIAVAMRTRKPVTDVVMGVYNPHQKQYRWLLVTVLPRFGPGTDEAIGTYSIFQDITERKQAEEALRKSEERAREQAIRTQMIMDTAPGGILLASDAECTVITGNRGAYEILNMSQGSNVSQSAPVPQTHWREYKDGKPLAPKDLPMQRAARGEVIRDFEMTFVFDDGAKKTVVCNASPVYGRDDAIAGSVLAMTDITERKRVEEALRESEIRYRQLADAAYEGLAVHENGILLDMNSRLAEMIGYDPADIIGRPILDLIDARFHASVKSHIDGGSEKLYEIELIHRDGHRIPVEVMAHSIWWHGRKARVAALRDVTERRRVEEELKMIGLRLRQIIDLVPNFIFAKDIDGHFLLVNDAVAKAYGTTVEGLVGKHDADFNPNKEEVEHYLADDRAVISSGQPKLIPEETITTADGQKTYLQTIKIPFTFSENNKPAVLGVSTNITDRKHAEEQIRRHAEELERIVAERTAQIKKLERQRNENEKQAAIGRMAARIAHEINNPLAGIKNSFLLVKRAIPTDYKHYEFVGRIDKELDRIARIVRQMFQLHKPESTAPALVNVAETLKDIKALLDGNARAQGVHLETDATAAAKPVYLHEDSLRQVLFSIIQNAIEASPAEGHVKVIASLKGTNLLNVFVQDQGCGIPPEIGSRIFEPFFTTKSDLISGGLGLGLSITKGVVEAMGGVLSYESEVGKGTTFQLILPVNQNQEGEIDVRQWTNPDRR